MCPAGSPSKADELPDTKKELPGKTPSSRKQSTSNVLLVDMNGDVPPEETLECSPPESPPSETQVKEEVEKKKVETKLNILPENLIKKLSREVGCCLTPLFVLF